MKLKQYTINTPHLLLVVVVIWQDSLEVNPRILIGSFLVGICHTDKGHKVGVLFIDFRKALDCVDHIILTEKLKAVGLSGDMWKWINDYLSNRMQGTSVSKSRSDRNPIRAGVPQGSLLGPRLFVSYVNDLPDSITSGQVYICTLVTPQNTW